MDAMRSTTELLLLLECRQQLVLPPVPQLHPASSTAGNMLGPLRLRQWQARWNPAGRRW